MFYIYIYKKNGENESLRKLQTELKRQIREHRASTSLPKFENQEI